MILKNIVFLLVSLNLISCVSKPFQPPPPEYKSWEKLGFSEDEIKNELLKCGYSNPFYRTKNTTANDIALRENCMLNKGFRYVRGYGGVCSLSGSQAIPACQSDAVSPKK